MTSKYVASPAKSFPTLRDFVLAESTKIQTHPLVWLSLGLATLVNVTFGILAAVDAFRVGTSDGAETIDQAGTLMLSPVYLFVGIAVFAAGSEYSGGQLRASLLAMPNRIDFLLAKLISVTAWMVLSTFVVVLPGFLVRAVPQVRDGDMSVGAACGEYILLVTVYVLMGYIGGSIAMLLKSSVIAISLLFSLPLLVSPVLRTSLSSVVRVLPHETSLSILQWEGGDMNRLPAMIVLCLWCTGALLIAGFVVCQRDSESGSSVSG